MSRISREPFVMRLVAIAGLLILLGLMACSWPLGRGQVREAHGPLSDAVVRLQGTSLHTTSQQQGNFVLPAFASTRRLTASRQGYFIAGVDPRIRVLRLRPLPDEDNPNYTWVDPTPSVLDEHRCGNCHSELYQDWQRSGHSRSVMGDIFRSWYSRLLQEHPAGSGVCASCHAPGLTEDHPAWFDLRQVRGVARHGVHCDYCHKVQGLGEGEIGLTHGRFLLQLLRPPTGEQLFFGPLDDVDRDEDAYSPIYRDSRYCAACHEGVLFGVRVYSTYTEWLESPARRAGLHCQNCHMKPTGFTTNVAPGHGGLHRDPHTLGNHRFWDGSQAAMLRRALHLDVHWQTPTVHVRLVAQAVGHRVPTGFIDRQLLLIVQALDERGQSLKLLSGQVLPRQVGPEFVGLPGTLFARIPRDAQGNGPVPFWHALPEVEDTRLQPGRPQQHRFTFAQVPAGVRVRVVHRRFAAEGSPQIVVFDRHFLPTP